MHRTFYLLWFLVLVSFRVIFSQARRSYYLFLLLVCVFGLVVENFPDSHKPVETRDLLLLTIQERGGAQRGPNRPAEAADGPLRGREKET